jgi:hypothetical protein
MTITTPMKPAMTATILCIPTASPKKYKAIKATKKTCAKLRVIAVVRGKTATAQMPHESATNAPIRRIE